MLSSPMGDLLPHRDTPSEDFLSNLPDALLHHILSSLPTRDSVCTSVLSRRWRRIWSFVPSISFNFQEPIERGTVSSTDIVDRFVAARNNSSSIYRLRLIFECVLDSDETRLCKWIDYAKSHGVQDVTLRIGRSRLEYTSLLVALFNWTSLTALDLQTDACVGRAFNLPECATLRNLKTLFLSIFDQISQESLSRLLLSCCPALEELTFASGYHTDDVIEIVAPNLLRLNLLRAPSEIRITCQKLESLTLNAYVRVQQLNIEAPSLVSVQLHHQARCFHLWHVGALLHRVCNVTSLTIDLRYLWFHHKLQIISVTNSFPILHKLLKLEVHLVLIPEDDSLDMLFSLLPHTPNLHSLTLIDQGQDTYDKLFNKGSDSFDIVPFKGLDHLKTVSLSINSKRAWSTILKMLSERVRAWDKVVVMYNSL